MKNAWVFWVTKAGRTGGAGLAWKWRSEDGAGESARDFAYFFECLEDARRHGYRPRIDA